MKKWLLIVLISLFFIVVGTSAFVYQLVREPLVENYEQANQYIVENSLLDTMGEISYYHGTKAYYVVAGIDEDGDESIVWVNEDFTNSVQRKASEGITYEEALNHVRNDIDGSAVTNIRLGYTRGTPIYEIMYTDETERQGYYYVTFEDGTFLKRYSIRSHMIN
ncbi:cell wall elongation regulator TseB-like domain-containing protein [Bacillus sp. FJAT-45037]|uniref:cell wall elongation regulator TseB-like domain-containing protein n=1 Tax=Bacillus sp. FJAT-45037 TaxID=2011007 RepID=UPI000C23C1F1|nr:DUF5590 domain-containing protein [Bacillus sp. FJAT-45037]